MYHSIKESLVDTINKYNNIVGPIHENFNINTSIFILIFYMFMYTLLGVTKYPSVDELYGDENHNNVDSIHEILANSLET